MPPAVALGTTLLSQPDILTLSCRAIRGLSNYMFHEATRMVKVHCQPERLLLTLGTRLKQCSCRTLTSTTADSMTSVPGVLMLCSDSHNMQLCPLRFPEQHDQISAQT